MQFYAHEGVISQLFLSAVHMTRRGWALFLALSVIWGVPYFMIRIAVRQLDPATLVFARTVPAALILIPVAIHRRVLPSLRPVWRWVALYTVVEFGIPWLLMGSAERHLSSSLTGLIVASVPLVSVAIAKFLHPNVVIGTQRLLGLAIGTLGVATLVGLDISGGSWMWVAAMLVVVAGYASGPMILSLKLNDVSGLAVVSASIAAVALVYLPWGATHWPTHLRPETWGSIGVLAFVCTAGGFLFLFASVKENGPSRTVVVTYFNTAIAVALGTAGLHEPLTAGLIIGFPMIVVGSIFATSRAPD